MASVQIYYLTRTPNCTKACPLGRLPSLAGIGHVFVRLFEVVELARPLLVGVCVYSSRRSGSSVRDEGMGGAATGEGVGVGRYRERLAVGAMVGNTEESRRR